MANRPHSSNDATKTSSPPSSSSSSSLSQRGFFSKHLKKLKRLASSFGFHKRTISVEGFRYRQRNAISLRRSLSDTGPGVKEYDLKYPKPDADHRRGMRIRYTKKRLYNDVGFDPRTDLYTQIIDAIPPGNRVLEIGCGTGAGSAILAQAVGPSGGVIAMNRDGESIRFARQRYPSNHCAFELGWIETLDGEINGAFDTVLAVDPMRHAQDAPAKARVIAELARILTAEGLMMVILSDPSNANAIRDDITSFGFKSHTELPQSTTCPRSGWIAMTFKRTEDTPPSPLPPPPSSHQGPDYPGSFQS